jgi:hypothetical protein
MLRTILSVSAVGAVVFAGSSASGQIVGPARRAAAGAAAAAGAPGVGARIENREAARGVTPGNRWRYVNSGNQWWYYTPQNSWMYYRNNAWAPYSADNYNGPAVPAAPMAPAGYGATGPGVVPNAWRYVYNGNAWWYYTPQNTWLYYGGNQWLPYQGGVASAPQYRTGYRGSYRGGNAATMAPPAIPQNPAADGGAAVQERAGAQGQAAPQGQIQTERPQQQAAPNQPPEGNAAPQPDGRRANENPTRDRRNAPATRPDNPTNDQ